MDIFPQIVDGKYLLNNLYLAKGFIERHARAMGSFGRPRKFLLKNVMAHLEALAKESQKKALLSDVELKKRIERDIEEAKARVEMRHRNAPKTRQQDF